MNRFDLAKYPLTLVMILTLCTHAIVTVWGLFPENRAMPIVSGDAITYLMPAQNLVQHGLFSRETAHPYLWEPYRTPGYPLVIAGAIRTFGTHEFALLASLFTSVMAAWAAFRFAELLGGGRRAAFFAGLAGALLPNSLGLSAMMLTDAMVGHLTIVWVFLLVKGSLYRLPVLLVLSVLVLMILQALKPTFNIAGIMVLIILPSYYRGRGRAVIAVLLVLATLPLPTYFSIRNQEDHGVRSASLLGASAVREYLQVRHIEKETGGIYAQITNDIRRNDALAAQQLVEPRSFYGRLYHVQLQRAKEFLSENPVSAAWLMFTEMVRQFLAPQEFFPQVFTGDLPVWGRAVGSLLTLCLWTCAFAGGYYIYMSAGDFRPLLLLGITLLFFLGTGSISHLVGARLRFPADVVALPFFGIGLVAILSGRSFRIKPSKGI